MSLIQNMNSFLSKDGFINVIFKMVVIPVTTVIEDLPAGLAMIIYIFYQNGLLVRETNISC